MEFFSLDCLPTRVGKFSFSLPAGDINNGCHKPLVTGGGRIAQRQRMKKKCPG